MDILLDSKGDLAIINRDLDVNDNSSYLINTQNTSVDLPVKNIFNSLYELTYRAVLTPLTYISDYTLDGNGIKHLDVEFGDGVYLDLGEPSTLNTLGVIKNHINKALEMRPPGVDILDLEIYFANFNSVKIDLKVLIKGTQYTQIFDISTSDIPTLD